jgi:hypothetical protein
VFFVSNCLEKVTKMSKIEKVAVAVAAAHVCVAEFGKIDYAKIASIIAPAFGKDWAENTAQTSLSTARAVLDKMGSADRELVVKYANEILTLAEYDGKPVAFATIAKGQAGRGGEDTLSAMRKKTGGKVLKFGSIGFDRAMGLNNDENGRV